MNSQTTNQLNNDGAEKALGDSAFENLSTKENDRLLDIGDVARIMNICKVTASAIMRESGHCIAVHRRKYILESDLFDFLKGLKH